MTQLTTGERKKTVCKYTISKNSFRKLTHSVTFLSIAQVKQEWIKNLIDWKKGDKKGDKKSKFTFKYNWYGSSLHKANYR
jgi:hypothetical protein